MNTTRIIHFKEATKCASSRNTMVRAGGRLANVLVGPTANIKIPDARVSAIVQCYNSASTMKDTLESLKGNVDRILCIDGFFRMDKTPHAHPAKSKTGTSTDNSRFLAKQYGAEWISGDREYQTQMDKLNRIPELVPDGEWAFIIDTDEVLVSLIQNGLRACAGWLGQWADMVPMRIDEPYYTHPFTGNLGRNRYYARLFRVKKGMRWPEEGTVIYPEGRVTLYMGTFPMTVYLKHLRRDP